MFNDKIYFLTDLFSNSTLNALIHSSQNQSSNLIIFLVFLLPTNRSKISLNLFKLFFFDGQNLYVGKLLQRNY